MDTRLITLENYQNALDLHENLKVDFPKCFFPLGKERPLKVGIYQDLVKLLEYSAPERKKILKIFLMLYTTSLSYRAALLFPKAVRIDLNGYEVGKVSPKAKYIAKTHCQNIIWELEEEGYEHQKMLAQRYKRRGTNTPEVMARLFPQPEKTKKPKKSSSTKQSEQAASHASQKMEIAKPLVSAHPKKPVTVTIKKKKNLNID